VERRLHRTVWAKPVRPAQNAEHTQTGAALAGAVPLEATPAEVTPVEAAQVAATTGFHNFIKSYIISDITTK